jgi:hypothetical protein
MSVIRIIKANLEVGERGYPISKGFRVKFCDDPNCGPHFHLLDRDDKVFCEMVLSFEQLDMVVRLTMEKL